MAHRCLILVINYILLISGFHRASLLLVTFINQLTHLIDTVVDLKFCNLMFF